MFNRLYLGIAHILWIVHKFNPRIVNVKSSHGHLKAVLTSSSSLKLEKKKLESVHY